MWPASIMQSILTAKYRHQMTVVNLSLQNFYVAVRLPLHLDKKAFLYLKHGNIYAESLYTLTCQKLFQLFTVKKNICEHYFKNFVKDYPFCYFIRNLRMYSKCF